MNNIFEGISESDKRIIRSVLPLVIVLALFLIVGKIAISQINILRSQINDEKKTESALSQKLEILKSVSATSADSVNYVLFALPKSNPSITLVSQLKMLASMNAVSITNIKSLAGEKSSNGLSSVNTTFNVSGTEPQVISFVKSIGTIAPMTFVQKLEIGGGAQETTANISVKCFFAPLPTTIPTVTQSVNDLTNSEKSTLTEISKLNQFVANTIQTSTTSASSVNPFGD